MHTYIILHTHTHTHTHTHLEIRCETLTILLSPRVLLHTLTIPIDADIFALHVPGDLHKFSKVSALAWALCTCI